ncbi:rhamnan synthesis F family protein [Azospirillum brasilense]|uniref:rhamnan synthesis F family protein n=1 Tax=Azospirillum brasilense TaxID=192 RepID=UPI000E67C807|nr:rhamnan synthesis F family protein [Azospirillum brasilense]NUB28213.1 hypothetical protein [Azospirillum brasilense]NUB35510.1 hypothetical protein [Azospirillum brasilense]RIV97297.1 hypothetical protein D2T81_29150 [Azospirillum brasilense]
MRILLYVEPHPIRNTLGHFADVARGYLSLLTSAHGLDIRLFANDKTFEDIGEAKLESHRKHLIRSTCSEESVFKGHMRPWESEGIPTWLDLMAGKGEVTERYLKVLRRIWSVFPFEIIVHWGENGAVTRFLDEHPVTRVAMELGCTRPPFFDSNVMDPYGVNGSGVTGRLTLDELRDIVGDRPMSRHEALHGFSQNLEVMGYVQQFQASSDDLSERLPRERLVYLPLQLFDDANLLRFSPYNTPSDVVLDVVPRLAESGYKVIIKPHPASKYREGSSIANGLARRALRAWSDHIIWSDEPNPIPNARLFAMTDFVVTVNSSVGFEALYFDKPVVVLGDAVYKPKGLFPTLDTMLSGDFDQEAYLDGAGILRRFMLGGYLQPSSIRANASAFGNRLGLIDHLHKQFPSTPAAFARDFWRACAPAQQAFAQSAMFRGLSVPGQGEFGVPSIPDVQAKQPVTHEDASIETARNYRPIIRRLLDHSAATNLCEFSEWLDSMWSTAAGRADLIRFGEFVDSEYYLTTYIDVKNAGVDPVEHFSWTGYGELRSPCAAIKGTTPEQTLAFLKLAAGSVLKDLGLLDFPLSEETEHGRMRQLEELRLRIVQSSSRIAVVAHLYYRDLVPQILGNLRTISEPFDLIVTMPDWGNRRIIEMVQAAYPDALFYEAANRGRDIGPFIDVLPTLLDKEYDAILKIQTKRGYYRAGRLVPELGQIWRNETLDALLGQDRVNTILGAFRANPDLNMIGPAPYFLSLDDYPYHDGGDLAERLLDDPYPSEGVFFAGTMFWVRPAALQALRRLTLTHFAPEKGENEGALAHLVERMFGHACTANGGKIATAPVAAEAPLNFQPEPTKIKLDTYLTARIEDLGMTQAGGARGALIW